MLMKILYNLKNPTKTFQKVLLFLENFFIKYDQKYYEAEQNEEKTIKKTLESYKSF